RWFWAMVQHFSEGEEIGKVVADERLDEADITGYLQDILSAAQSDDTLSAEARALAAEDSPFSVADGANTLIVEGTLTYTFVVAVAKGAGTAVGGLVVKELWNYVKARLQRRDPTGIKKVEDGPAPASPKQST
ncbi:MAG: hypothetical protein AAFO51_09910, partial [Pseudomonadota bacterium]